MLHRLFGNVRALTSLAMIRMALIRPATTLQAMTSKASTGRFRTQWPNCCTQLHWVVPLSQVHLQLCITIAEGSRIALVNSLCAVRHVQMSITLKWGGSQQPSFKL